MPGPGKAHDGEGEAMTRTLFEGCASARLVGELREISDRCREHAESLLRRCSHNRVSACDIGQDSANMGRVKGQIHHNLSMWASGRSCRPDRPPVGPNVAAAAAAGRPGAAAQAAAGAGDEDARTVHLRRMLGGDSVGVSGGVEERGIGARDGGSGPLGLARWLAGWLGWLAG